MTTMTPQQAREIADIGWKRGWFSVKYQPDVNHYVRRERKKANPSEEIARLGRDIEAAKRQLEASKTGSQLERNCRIRIGVITARIRKLKGC